MPPIKRKNGEIVNGDLRASAQRSVDEREVLRAFFPIEVVRDGGETPEGEVAATADGTVSQPVDGPIRVLINTNDIDRHDTIVDPSGADVNMFLKNPVLLYQHGCDHVVGDWVVGKVVLGEFSRDAIAAELVFDLEGKLHGDENKLIGKELDRMYRAGWLRGVSIGFITKGYAIEDVGGREVLRYTDWELVELSCVAVPSNPMALAEAVRSTTDPVLLKDLRAIEAASKATEDDIGIVVRDLKSQVANLTAELSELRKIGRNAEPTKAESVKRQSPSVAVEWERPYDVDAEFAAAGTDAKRSEMCGLVIRNGSSVTYEFPYRHVDGRINWRMLAAQMARLLSGAVKLTADQLDAAYDAMAGDYRKLGVAVPEPTAKTPDQAYDLALQGRIAHVDKQGRAWVFVETIERDGKHYPGFVRVDDDNATLVGPLPQPGRLTDHRQWGQRREVVTTTSEQVLEKLLQTQKEILEHQVRVGAKFSSATRSQLMRTAEGIEAAAKSISDGINGLNDAASGLRALVQPDESDESKGVSGSNRNDGGPANSQVRPGGAKRQISPRQ